MIIGVDPGTETSGVVHIQLVMNRVMFSESEQPNSLVKMNILNPSKHVAAIVCEWIEHYGKDIHPGAETFHTCRWIGRFEEAAYQAGLPFRLVTRREVKLHLCGTARADDAAIRTALIDRLGGKGTKRLPGPLYGVSGHAWAALAVALTFADKQKVAV